MEQFVGKSHGCRRRRGLVTCPSPVPKPHLPPVKTKRARGRTTANAGHPRPRPDAGGAERLTSAVGGPPLQGSILSAVLLATFGLGTPKQSPPGLVNDRVVRAYPQCWEALPSQSPTTIRVPAVAGAGSSRH